MLLVVLLEMEVRLLLQVVGVCLLVGMAPWGDESHGSRGVMGVDARVHVVVLDVTWGWWRRRGWALRAVA